jgi:3-oxoadipate enol-lactonase
MVAYEEQGTGTPLILLHATLGDHGHFADIVPTLARTYRTLAVDWPGFGESESPNPPRAGTPMYMADVLEEIVERLDLEPAILIGNSIGGYAAARLAIRHPERVRALILVSTAGFITAGQFTCWLFGQEWFARLIATRFAKTFLKLRTPLVEQIIARIDAGRAIPARVAVDAAIWRSFVRPELNLRPLGSQIKAPTLVINGRYDPVIRYDRDESQASIPHAQRIILETGHEPFAEDPEAFLKAITPFLQSIEEERRSHASSNTPGAH